MYPLSSALIVFALLLLGALIGVVVRPLLPEEHKATEVTPGEYLVEGSVDPQVLATVTAWCAQIDVLATDLRVEQRSLEDVFLDLTGRKLRQ